MESLYHSTNRALQEVHQGFLQCEKSMGAAKENVQGFHRELQKRVEQIIRWGWWWCRGNHFLAIKNLFFCTATATGWTCWCRRSPSPAARTPS
jgi:hypothetical protein